MSLQFEPFRVSVPESELTALRARLALTRWPEAAPVPGWTQGIPLEVVADLCRHWATGHDWRAAEARLNAYPQYLVEVDGVRVHVLHARSGRPGAMPLVLTHGWPGSVLELVGLAGPLTEAGFDVVIPSLPGYGFSAPPTVSGWGVERIAAAWAGLMAGFGYERYGAAGSDWGTSVSSMLGVIDAEHVVGVHLVPPLAGPETGATDDLTEAESAALARMSERGRTSSGYSEMHRTAPQTIGYALLDSPVGLCAWMAEKLIAWSGVPLSRDQILDQVTLYWLTGTGASSARLYAESIETVSGWISGTEAEPVRVPVGASLFPAEVPLPSRRWVERRYPDIRYWAEHDRGGHFPALEVPELLVGDLRAFFGPLRRGRSEV